MDQEKNTRAVQAMPTLALRGLVAFPGVTMHFDVKRPGKYRSRGSGGTGSLSSRGSLYH